MEERIGRLRGRAVDLFAPLGPHARVELQNITAPWVAAFSDGPDGAGLVAGVYGVGEIDLKIQCNYDSLPASECSQDPCPAQFGSNWRWGPSGDSSHRSMAAVMPAEHGIEIPRKDESLPSLQHKNHTR